jgi:hypothetical protein
LAAVLAIGSLSAFVDRLSDDAKDLGLAVCITGEISRVELFSKLKYMVEPLRKEVSLGVFVSLETGVHFSDDDSADEVCQRPATMEKIQQTFGDSLKGSTVLKSAREDVPVDKWPNLYTQYDGCFDCPERKEHLSNLLAMFKHWSVCHDLIQAEEKKAGGSYRMVLRVRDDTLAVDPVPWSSLKDTNGYKTKDCFGWGGVNDKTAAISRHFAWQVLTGPYTAMKNISSGTPDKFWASVADATNSETILSKVLGLWQVPLDLVKMEENNPGGFPLVKGSCSGSWENGDDKWCPTEESEDCYPPHWSYANPCAQAS